MLGWLLCCVYECVVIPVAACELVLLTVLCFVVCMCVSCICVCKSELLTMRNPDFH